MTSLTIIVFIGRVKSYYLQFNSNIQTISIKSVAQKWKRKWRWKKWEKASQFSSDSEFSPLALKKNHYSYLSKTVGHSFLLNQFWQMWFLILFVTIIINRKCNYKIRLSFIVFFRTITITISTSISIRGLTNIIIIPNINPKVSILLSINVSIIMYVE